MQRGSWRAVAWVAVVTAIVGVLLLVVDGAASIHAHLGLAWLAAVALAATLTFAALSARAGHRAPKVAFVLLAITIEGATTSVHASAAVAAFAFAAFVPLTAVALIARKGLPLVLVGIATLSATTARLLFRDPFLELRCQPFCDTNPFLVEHLPQLVRATEWALVVSVAATIASPWLLPSRSSKRSALRASAGGLPAALAAVSAARLAWRPRRVPDAPIDLVLDAGELLAVVLIASTGIRVAWRTLTERRQVRSFIETMAHSSELAEIEGLLRTRTHDPTVAVHLGDHRNGLGPTSEVTAVVRDGRTVATLTHGAGSRARLGSALSPALALVLETHLLLDIARCQVEVVDASRARALESTDAARRALERNLHDGAQQHLLVVGMMLAASDSSRDPKASGAGQAGAEVTEALRELRRIARGDAATIAELGLLDATTAVAGAAAVPVRTEVVGCAVSDHECWPLPTATAAYRLFVSTVAEAEGTGAQDMAFTAECLGSGKGRQVDLRHDGRESDRRIDHDRVLAAGGQATFGVESGRRVVTAWLP